jgi:fumarylacetoacetate (FAA) hydrolase family protein
LISSLVSQNKQFFLIAPCDFQAIKACGVTFAKSMVERVIEERAAGIQKRLKIYVAILVD